MSSPVSLPKRPLGGTGHQATLLGLGGEGVLRTDGRMADAVRVISRALDLGVNYFDTAPAYASSRDYYGAALGERRRGIFLASKTHDRTRDGSLRLLEDSLRRLRTNYLDLWQLHDLRSHADLDRIFAPGGALEALRQAREEGRVRHLGITGHHDPAILLEALRRFEFDTLLVALNPADVHRLSFIQTVLPAAVSRGLGVIAMKVCSQGALLAKGGLTMEECLGYALSLPGVSTAIVGCWTPEEVEDNARIVRALVPFDEARLRELERKTARQHSALAYYKRPGS